MWVIYEVPPGGTACRNSPGADGPAAVPSYGASQGVRRQAGRWAVTDRPHRRQKTEDRRHGKTGSSVAAVDGRGEFNCPLACRVFRFLDTAVAMRPRAASRTAAAIKKTRISNIQHPMFKEEVQTEDSDLDVGYSLLDIGHSCLWGVWAQPAMEVTCARGRAYLRAGRMAFLTQPWQGRVRRHKKVD